MVLTGAYAGLPELDKALDSALQAQRLWHAQGSRSAEANALMKIANIYSFLGDHGKALEYDNEALLLERASGEPRR
jgi:tetratricopeptide (TPR) repeat protein